MARDFLLRNLHDYPFQIDMRTSIYLFLFASFCLFTSVSAQVSIRDSAITINTINLTAKGQLSGGDMGERFGATPAIGFEVGRKWPSNLYGRIGGFFLLGGTVREDSMLRNISTPSGMIINDLGQPTEVRLMQTGFVIPVSVGKVIPVFPKHNPNSGLYIEIGAQFIQHKINFQPFDGPIAALSSTNKKGYDRLTNGIGIRQGIGYQYYSNSGNFNISFGLDFSQNFTQNRRTTNWDTGERDDTQRLDLLSGVSVTWSWLIYDKAPPKFYFN